MKNIIRQYKTAYQKTGKTDKKTVTATVVSVITNDDSSGKVRFLKQKKFGIDEPWYEASSVEIWKKVSHLLRCSKQYNNKNFLQALSTRTTGTVVPLLSSLLEDYEEGSSSLLEDCLTCVRNVASSPVTSLALKDKDVLREELPHEEDAVPLLALPILQLSTRMIMTASEEEKLFGFINDFQDNVTGCRPPSPSIFDVDDNEFLITPFDEGYSPRLA
jgi:hypothetical protein